MQLAPFLVVRAADQQPSLMLVVAVFMAVAVAVMAAEVMGELRHTVVVGVRPVQAPQELAILALAAGRVLVGLPG